MIRVTPYERDRGGCRHEDKIQRSAIYSVAKQTSRPPRKKVIVYRVKLVTSITVGRNPSSERANHHRSWSSEAGKDGKNGMQLGAAFRVPF